MPHASLPASTYKLHHLAQGPAAAWMGTMNGIYGDAMTAAAIYRFDITEHVPIDGEMYPLTAKCPSRKRHRRSACHYGDFKNVIRYAMTKLYHS
jgi:hypothetical protein